MLTDPRQQRAKPPTQSLRKAYEEYIAECVEEYKSQIPRSELLELADEAVLSLAREDPQLSFTEVLLTEKVDELIVNNLKLPSFIRWKRKYAQMRAAQSDPAHWGIDKNCPMIDFATRLEATDTALVVGKSALGIGFFLAAHDVPVLFVDGELETVDAAEHRAASEALVSRFEAFVVDLGGGWFPEVVATLVVLDPMALSSLSTAEVNSAITVLKELTAPGGIHCILPEETSDPNSRMLQSRTIQQHYIGWASRHSQKWLVNSKLASSQ